MSALQLQEIEEAERSMLRLTQKRWFLAEVEILVDRRPFIDQQGLLHVGGRLRRAELVKHPIILHSLSHGGPFHHRVFSSTALGLAPLEAISVGFCAVGTYLQCSLEHPSSGVGIFLGSCMTYLPDASLLTVD